MSIGNWFAANLAPCAGIIFLLLFLRANSYLEMNLKKDFYLMVLLASIELIAYDAELVTASFAEPTIWRIILSVIGYSIRPLLVLVIIRIHLRNAIGKKAGCVLLIPAYFNTCVVCTAFFTDIAFSYDEQNVFHRGPLGFSPQITTAVYLLILLVLTFRGLYSGHKLESYTILIASFYLTVTMVVEAVFKERTIGRTAIIMSTVFYYMYFQTANFKNSLVEEQRSRAIAENKSRTDSLTGLLNKEAFTQEVQMILNAFSRESVALLFLDLDNFKNVNDRLGHLVGDFVIKDSAKKIAHGLRKDDVAGRFGGDEFCILLRNIPYDVLERRLDELLGTIKHTYSVNGASVTVTASIGVAYLSSCPAPDCNSVLQLADTAVYEAKEAGRNRYVIKQYPTETL